MANCLYGVIFFQTLFSRFFACRAKAGYQRLRKSSKKVRRLKTVMVNAFNVPHKFDKSNLRKVILEAPKQFEEGFRLGSNIKLDGEFSKAVFYGEGGSAFPVSLVDTLVKDAAYKVGNDAPRIYQNHTYLLSPEASKDAINIFCSYSGNTEETIATLTKALEKDLPSVVIASGGKLEEIANSVSTPFVKLPVPSADFQPRMGTGDFFS